MDMPPPRPAVDLSAARQRAVVGERQRGVLDDAPLTLVPIVLDRVREIDQDMPRPLREVVAMHPAALGDREFGKHARFELRSIIAGLGDFFGIRSEEHTSELQSLMRISYAVFCLKKKKKQPNKKTT